MQNTGPQRSGAARKRGEVDAARSVPDPQRGPNAAAGMQRRSAAYQIPRIGCSLFQLANTFGLFFAACALMYVGVGYGFWFALLLLPIAALALVRIFIIQHDCGHGSFFRRRWANHLTGAVCSLVTLTPYASWRRQHAGHHVVWNDLDERYRGVDIYSSTVTVDEYLAYSRRRQNWYRFTRNPIVANLLLPPLIFLVLYRFPFDSPKAWRVERAGVHATNAGIATVVLGLCFALGFAEVGLVQLPVIALASIVGVWLFSIQHRFERTLWTGREQWDYAEASVRGSSYLALPPILRWFTGNIGYHHVHHLNPGIPNYRLRACHEAEDGLQAAPVLTLWTALRQWRFVLWDTDLGRMVEAPQRPART